MLEAQNGGEASRSTNDTPAGHLLLTDVVMPRINRPALFQRLLAMRERMKALYMSGYADAKETQMASSSGTCRVLLYGGVSSLLAVQALACGDDAETARPAIDASSAGATLTVDPGLICRDQLATTVTLHGEHFTAIAGDPPQRPSMTLPTVTFSRGHELDGDEVGSPEQVVYSGDPEADPTNALDEQGDPIEVNGRPLLQWQSEQEMSVLVTQSLVLGPNPEGDDARERGSLLTGIWDVGVQNPKGQSADALGVLAVVERPKLEELEPAIVCLDQGPRTLSLRGRTLLRNAGAGAQLAIEGMDVRVELELSDCTAIDRDGLDAELCKRASATLVEGSVPPGYPALTLENRETAACKSEEELSLRVVPGPVIVEVIDALACVEQRARTFVIKGQHFLRLDGTTLPRVSVGDREFAVMAMECDAALPAGEHTVEQCSSLTIAVKPGELDAGVYDVTVVNPDNLAYPDDGGPQGCSNIASNALRIAPPPSIDEAQPSYVCLDDADRERRVHGSDFLTVDGVVPSVEVDGAVLPTSAIATEDCDAMGADVSDLQVDRCSTLVLRVGQDDVDTGNPVLKITNPSPAGCDVEAINAWTVLPPPRVKLTAPQPICNRQGDRVIALAGNAFVDLAGAPPTVMIGDVAATSVAVVDASCTPIAGRGGARLCTELTATVPAGSLSAGLYDVAVSNAEAAGCRTQQSVTLAVVDAPAVATVAPDPICLAQGAVGVTITGTSFVRIGTAQPTVAVGGVAASNAAVTDSTCTPVPGASDAVACTELTATLAMDALAVDTSDRVVITNPEPAGCASHEALDLQVVAPPQIASLAANVCTGGGRVSISGANLTGLSAHLVDPDTQVAIEALDTVVDATGTQATIRFSSVVAPDTYQLVITSTSGCTTTAAQSVVATPGPVLFAVDPQVGYDGAALRATLYASGLTAVPAGVVLTPHGRAGAPDQHALTSVLWPDGSDNEVGATIPAGVPAGSYDVTLDFTSGCDPVLAQGLRVDADTTLGLTSPALSPRFGEQHSAVAVALSAEPNAALAAGEVNFRATPRAYLWSAALSTAQPLGAVAFDSQERLTAIVPDTLTAGSYDLLVLNPDGSVGFQADAYEATAVAPPVIYGLTPAHLDNDTARPITIAGAGFVNPAADMEVTLECLSPGASEPTAVGPLAIDGASSTSSLVATVPAGVAHGSVCVVRVTNTTNATWAEFSTVAISDPASELPEFQSGPALVEARRAAAGAIARATRTARFVYAIGGDDGDAAHAKASVEAAALGRFGDPGAFRKLTTTLSVPVT
ncbi:MAG TPA: hypothetical protein VK509_10245, partial [Polyangiales bacterium]|nr:hypothetical protein [Polyangiales bacterium]